MAPKSDLWVVGGYNGFVDDEGYGSLNTTEFMSIGKLWVEQSLNYTIIG